MPAVNQMLAKAVNIYAKLVVAEKLIAIDKVHRRNKERDDIGKTWYTSCANFPAERSL